jgi:type IV pilus assembly protein PilM
MISLFGSRSFPIGLHLTQGAATLVQLCRTEGRYGIQAMAHSEIRFDENATPEEQDRTTAEALQKLVSDHPFKGRQVVSCLGFEELFVQNVRLPELPPEEVEKVIRWEAEERLPFPVNEAEVRHLIAGHIRQDSSVRQEVILLACREEVIRRHIDVLEQAGLAPSAVDIEPCAVVRCFRRNEQEDSDQHREAFLNLGRDATSVIFAEGEQIIFLKFIAIGGRDLDLAVARNLDIRVDEASQMRCQVTASSQLDAENDVHRSVIESIRPSLENMVSEIELCLRYYKVTFRGKHLEQISLTGAESTPWLADYVSDRLHTRCVLGRPFEGLRIDGDDAVRHVQPARCATAIGLAMKQT